MVYLNDLIRDFDALFKAVELAVPTPCARLISSLYWVYNIFIQQENARRLLCWLGYLPF